MPHIHIEEKQVVGLLTMKSKPCPVCGSPIDTTKPVVTFWRCGSCREAIKLQNGRLQRWLNPYQQPKRKSRR